MKLQHTINHEVAFTGRGLFTGEPVSMRIKPGEPDSGLCFVRTDQNPAIRIPALVKNVSNRARRTTLRNGTVSIETVEHCLSAFAGLGLDNLLIELDANEIPAMDGSSLQFVEKLRSAGICEQQSARKPHIITDIIRVADGDCELIALPPMDPESETFEISYDLDYGPDSPINRQFYRVMVTPESFEANIAPARTFVLEEEAKAMRDNGLGMHLTYEDILVFGPDGPIENTLRFPDECVRHKILDLIGDLNLLGRSLIGRIHARKSGHALNHALVRELQEQYEAKQYASFIIKQPEVDIHKIHKILPHRYPFLMIDRVLEVDGSRRAVGIKNVTINEPFFQGHYPGDPIMPGVLIIEGLAQIGGVLLSQELEHKGKVAVLLSLDKVKFRRAVRPGDQLILEAVAIRIRSNVGHVRCKAMVGGEVVTQAEIKFILTDTDTR